MADKGQEHINGFFYMHTEDLINVKGFNEYITTYGWGDDDLYQRLQNFGLKRKVVNTNTIYHLPHDDSQCFESSSSEENSNALDEICSSPAFNIRKNRFIAQIAPPWKHDKLFSIFKVESEQENIVKVHRLKNSQPHFLSRDIQENAVKFAILELTSWNLGPQA